jgi:hypothetical protein
MVDEVCVDFTHQVRPWIVPVRAVVQLVVGVPLVLINFDEHST